MVFSGSDKHSERNATRMVNTKKFCSKKKGINSNYDIPTSRTEPISGQLASLTIDECTRLIQEIKNDEKSRTSIELQYLLISSEFLTQLLKILSKNTKIIYLNLTNQLLTFNHIRLLALTLQDHFNLQYLFCRNCQLGNTGVWFLMNSLSVSNSSQITWIRLGNNQISNEGAIAISLYLECKGSTCIELNISQNLIENKGGICIAKSLYENKRLIDLRLWDNKISDDGMIAFAKCFKVNKTLREVYLDRNCIEKEGKEALNKVRKDNKIANLKVLEY